MLRWLSKEFLVAVIVSLVIALIVVSLGGTPSEHIQPPGEQGGKNPQSNHAQTNQLPVLQIQCNPNCTATNPNEVGSPRLVMRVFNKVIDDPITAGILIANFLLVIVVLAQVGDARETTKRELRAYLSVESGSNYRQTNRRHTRFEFRPNVVNNGRTPASNVRILSLIELRSGPIPRNFDFSISPIQAGSIATIGAGKEKFHQSIFPRFLTWRELREHAKGGNYFHLWGQVTYLDIFKRERHTYFSYVITVPPSKRGITLWHATDRHNDYD